MLCENCGAELQDPNQEFCLNCGIPLRINIILTQFVETNPGIEACAIASKEGLPLVSALPQDVDETRIAAMTTALFSLAERSIIEFDKGNFHTLYIKGSNGYLLVFQADSNAVLAVSTTADLRLGSIPINLISAIDTDLKRMAYEKIKSIMLEEGVNELTIDRKYLPEILHADQLEISPKDGLPTLKSFLIQYFYVKGILIQISSKEIKFIYIEKEDNKRLSLEKKEENKRIVLKNVKKRLRDLGVKLKDE